MMMMLIPFGVINKNGRRYLSEEVEFIEDRPLLGTLVHPMDKDSLWMGKIPIADVAATAKVIRAQDGIYIDIKFEGVQGLLMEEGIANGLTPVANGFGRLDEDGTVREFKLVSFFLTNVSAFETLSEPVNNNKA